MKSRVIALSCLLLLSLSGMGQILDDTTKLVYGATTSKYIFEHDLRHSDSLFHFIDTTLTNLEDFEFIRSADIIYQDLGNNGTALSPLYYQIPTRVGRATGQEAYSPYELKAEDLKFYDTKSPFVNIYLGFGGMNRNLVDFSFSRNINPQWNIGFDIKKISSNKLLGASSLREAQLKHTSTDFYVYHRSKSSKYHLMFHAYKMEHEAAESGGIVVEDRDDRKDYFLYLDSDVNLSTAFSFDERTRLRLYQDYSIKPFLELYNVIERKVTLNRYEDTSPSTVADDGYYDQLLLRSDSTLDAATLGEWSVEAGLKGRIGSFIFYSANVKQRVLDYSQSYSSNLIEENELSIGGDIKIHITKSNVLSGKAQVLNTGQYFFRAAYKNNFISASYSSTKSRPSFFSERNFGNHYEWSNSFKDSFSNTISGSIFYDFAFVRLAPEVQISTINNYVYFDQSKLAAQSKEVILANKYLLNMDFKLGKHFKLDNKLIFNNISGGDEKVIRSPDWNYVGRWYYDNIVFNDFMEMQIGFDLSWHSLFYSNAYDPITQQFHLQDEFNVGNYLRTDLFFVMKANRLSLWLKWNHLNQRVENGYFSTPYYPGTKRTIDLGLRWHFYD